MHNSVSQYPFSQGVLLTPRGPLSPREAPLTRGKMAAREQIVRISSRASPTTKVT